MIVSPANSPRHSQDASARGLDARRRRFCSLVLACHGAVSAWAADGTVVFNEVMYHPATNESALEWVELGNQMSVDMDLSGWSITNGVQYVFPRGTILRGGDYLVVASSLASWTGTIGPSNLFGPFEGRLANSGEKLELRNHNGRLIDALSYCDDAPWPAAADGGGPSLAKLSLQTASKEPENWTQSAQIGGTPGAPNFTNTMTPSPLVLNEIAGANSVIFSVELVNRSTTNLNLAGWSLETSTGSGRRFDLPNQVVAPGGFASFDQTQLCFRTQYGDKLFLYPPGRTSVADAVQARALPIGRWPDGSGDWFCLDAASLEGSNTVTLSTDVVINEIMYHHQPVWEKPTAAPPVPFHESTESWIELYNRSTNSVDLTGWRLDEGIRFGFPPGTTIPAGGFLVVAKDAAALRALHPGIAIVGPFTNELSRRSDRLALKDTNDNPADVVRYFDSGRWPELADGGGSSLELSDPRADNAQGEAWSASNEGRHSQWQTYTYRGVAQPSPVGPDGQWREFVLGLIESGEVWLDDVSVVEDPDGARVQMLQNTTFAAGTNAWRIIGNHHGEVMADPDQPGNMVLRLVARGPTEHWSNHAETTFANNRTVVNGRGYEISFRAKWIAGCPRLNTRLYFNRLARTTLLEVPEINGTPGAENSCGTTNLGPTFEHLAHTPVVPGANQPVTISVDASDPDGLGSLTLWWSANGGAWTSGPMTARTAHGSYQEFARAIPGYPAGTLVQFYVAATDTRGAQSCFPARGREACALYRVNDGAANGAPAHTVRILMTSADAQRLQAHGNQMSNDRLGATVIYDENQVFYNLGVGLKGSPYGRALDPFVSFSINFPGDQLFRGVLSSIDLDRSGRGQIPSPAQDEILIKHFMIQAGLPGEYNDLVRVIAPRPENTSSALLVLGHHTQDYLDSLSENGGDSMLFEFDGIYYPTRTVDGNAQSPKVVEPSPVSWTDFRDHGDDKEAYRWNFLPKNHRDREDFDGLIATCKAFSATGSALSPAVAQRIDLDEWLRLFAAISLAGVRDVYSGINPHNLMLYARPDDGRFVALPHDLDESFLNPVTAPIYGTTHNVSKVIAPRENLSRYCWHLRNIITNVYNREYMSYWVAHYQRFLPGQDFGPLLTYIQQRGSYVLSQIADSTPFAITSFSGKDFLTTSASATLRGTAPLEVQEIRLAGETNALAVNWLTTTTWEIKLPVTLGSNRVELAALDSGKNVAATAAINITSTATTGGTDSDGDGLPDLWESRNGLSLLIPDASLDLDGDGFSNVQEYLAGTDPRDDHSVPQLKIGIGADNRVSLNFVAMAGRSYSLLSRDQCNSGAWIKMTNLTAVITNRMITVTAPRSSGVNQSFIRLVTPKAP